MEEQELSLYAKLANSLYKEIIISYYSNLKEFKTEKFRLIDIYDFPYITISNRKVCTEISFFSTDCLIESITIVGEDTPIYFNPYIKQFINEPSHSQENIVGKIKQAFFDNIDINKFITKKELFMIKYRKKTDFELKDLFFSDTQKHDFSVLIKQIVKELVDYAKTNGLDPNIYFVSRGSTSFVYRIGDKILKFGKPRTNHYVPYCEYLLQPIINRDFTFDGIPTHIEVTERVITYKDLDDTGKLQLQRQIPKLRRKLHSIGLKCSDLHKRNIGILMHDNIIRFDNINFEVGSELVTSIRNNNNLVVRKKGEIVIIDLDYLQIVNVRKYCKYLASIGYDTEQINDIKRAYGIKVKTR